MTNSISDTLLSQFNKFVATQMGLHFSKKRWRDLERGISSAAREFGFNDAESCIQWLASSPLTKNQIEILASYLTVGETYFLREKRSFEILEKHILPELIRSRRGSGQRLRIWSAACCTGEEPYSIAMLLNKIIPDLKDWNVTILATDINRRFLQKASEGVYREWSFRDTSPDIKEKYFERTKGGQFEILPHIKKMVKFSYLNLAEDDYPSLLNNTSAIDIIFCRNVLMYFAPELAKKVIQNLYLSLLDGGWLVVAPSESLHLLNSQFITVNFPGVTFYRKDSKKSQTVEDFLPKETQSYAPHKETMVPFQPSFESVDEQEPEVDKVERGKWKKESKDAGSNDSSRYKRTAEVVTTKNLYIEASALYEQGRYSEAAEKLIELSSHDIDNPKAIALLARAYANQGKLAEALEWCKKAIATDKLNPALHYFRATILQEQGQLEEAVMSLKRALYLDQNFVLAHFALGNIARQQGKFNESDKHFENALTLLDGYQQEEILPESEGMTAGRLMEIIQFTLLGIPTKKLM